MSSQESTAMKKCMIDASSYRSLFVDANREKGWVNAIASRVPPLCSSSASGFTNNHK